MNPINEAIEKLEIHGLLKPELRLGVVSSVTAYLLRVNLGYAGNPSAAYFSGGRYGKGEVGEFVLVESQQGLLFGRVVEVRLPESDRRAVSQDYAGTDNLDAIAMVQLLGSVPIDRISITAGVASYPRLGDRVYAAPHQFIALIPALIDLKDDKPKSVRLTLGTVSGASEGKISVTPETLFGRHCAILGTTGGGKSWTTARIIEESIKHQAKIILLDATGEYREFSGEHMAHCHLGDPLQNACQSRPCSLPPTSFQESDFIALFDPAGKVQGPKLKAAIRSLRVAALKPGIATNGIIKKIDNAKSNYISALQDDAIAAQIDDPRQPFDIKKLSEQIEQECVYPDGFGIAKGVKDTSKWGGESGEFSHCLSLVSRINGVLTSVAFDCVFKNSTFPITTEIDSFFANKKRLLRICLSGIQHEYYAREIISNVLGRYLLSEARAGKFKQHPLVVIVDEAHNFLGKHIGSEDTAARLEAFELIAKEGRKYGLNICLATQRPRDITEGVLSQMGTLIVHRLTNDRDREVVERACGEIDRSASAFLPNLKPGEAAIIGVDFPIPLTVQINEPTVKPKSDGPDFQQCWSIKANDEQLSEESVQS
jgi:uncharacterized protein